jgi:hypothetical protein
LLRVSIRAPALFVDRSFDPRTGPRFDFDDRTRYVGDEERPQIRA